MMRQEKTKEERINAEIKRLTQLYKNLKDDKKLKVAQGLISRAAYMRISLEEYEKDILENGSIEQFSQGSQEPYDRKRPVTDLYNSMNTNYQKIIKQLTDLLPEEKGEEDNFIKFLNGGDTF